MAERFIFYLFILITVRVPLNSGIINSFCEISCSTMWLAAARLWVISIQLIRNSKHPWIGCFTDIHIFFFSFYLTALNPFWTFCYIATTKTNNHRWIFQWKFLTVLPWIQWIQSENLSLQFLRPIQEFSLARSAFKVSEKFTFYSFFNYTHLLFVMWTNKGMKILCSQLA